MSYTNPTPTDTTFNAEYVELVALGADSVADMIDRLATDMRRSAAHFAEHGDEATAASLRAAAKTYAHCHSMLDLAWDQAMARVARQTNA